MRKIGLLLPFLFAVVACDAGPADPANEPTTERGAIGKADLVGSCEASDGGDYCGGPSQEGNCWCDDLCDAYGDCCSDEPQVCDGEPPAPELCLNENECGAEETCDMSVCLPCANPDDGICPAVCFGQCVPDEDTSCLASSDCGEDEFCSFPEECGEGPEGTCEVRPDFCTQQFDPVCGCDGETYGNACGASAAGVSVQSEGACPTPPSTCEGSCGGQANGCWCDDLCENYGDCCDDYQDECVEVDVCEQLVADFQAETVAIRSCEDASECGQVLTGTSCGCSRNWVAREDADIGDWQDLRQQAQDNQCELPGMISTCDCPATAGFACEEGICTWNYQ